MAFWDRMQDMINQGLDNSRVLLNKTGEKVKDFGEIGVLKFEVRQLENQAEKLMAKLGGEVFKVLIEEEHSRVSKKTPHIREILTQIQDLKQLIESKEVEIKKHEKQ